MTFVPRLTSLPGPLACLWPELRDIPSLFILYGGTAIALRLGHRQSVDFDFFSAAALDPDTLIQDVPLLAGAERLQSGPNTLTVVLHRGEPVKLSFFGAIPFGRVGTPDQATDNSLWVASLLDLAAVKMTVVQQRAEKKDYLDIYAILTQGIRVEEALGAAKAIHGASFNPAITLKALTWYHDGDLPTLPLEVQQFLTREATRVRVIPAVPRKSDKISPPEPGR